MTACNLIQIPVSEIGSGYGNERTQYADDDALDQERIPDEAVLRTDVAHDRQFIGAVLDRCVDRIGDQEQRQQG